MHRLYLVIKSHICAISSNNNNKKYIYCQINVKQLRVSGDLKEKKNEGKFSTYVFPGFLSLVRECRK